MLAGLFVSSSVALAQVPNADVGKIGGPHPLTTALLRNIGTEPTLIAWIVDASLEEKDRPNGIPAVLDRVFLELEPRFAGGEQLLNAAVAVESGAAFLIEKPTSEWATLRRAIQTVKDDGTGLDNLFTGIRETALKYRRYQTVERRKLIIVLVADEIGDDADQANETAGILARNKVVFHAVAPIAAFGRNVIHDRWEDPDTKFSFYLPLKRGPFTRRVEFLSLSREDPPLSAGFGPFHLALLANNSGGQFLPFEDGRLVSPPYDPAMLAKYAPNYGDARSYQEAELTPHRLDLVKVAEGVAKTAYRYTLIGWIHDETRAEDLERWQKECLTVLAATHIALPLLQNAEKEWAAESSPRWRANYDLSMGRLLLAQAASAEVRAALDEFAANPPVLSDAKNNGWCIDWTPQRRPGADAALLEQSVVHFDRVLKEHPGTPWHYAAQLEKSKLAGVRWKEGFDRDHVRIEDRPRRGQVRPPKL